MADNNRGANDRVNSTRTQQTKTTMATPAEAPAGTMALTVTSGRLPIRDATGQVLYRPDDRAAAVSDEEADRVVPLLQTLWPEDLKNNRALAVVIAKMAIAYGLDPTMNEVTVYRGRPFFPLEGRLRIAQNRLEFQGVFARPATEEERQTWQVTKPTTVLWRAEAYRTDWVDPATGQMRPVIGWGEVDVQADQNPVAKQKPNQQAEVRATKRALRVLFSAPLPFADLPDELEGQRVQNARWVDSANGQVLDTRPGGMLLTVGQNAAIHALCKEAGIDDVERHGMLKAMFGKDATNELNEADAAAFLEFLAIRMAKPQLPDPRDVAITVEAPKASRRFNTVPGWPRNTPAEGETPAGEPSETDAQPDGDADENAAEAGDAERPEMDADIPEAVAETLNTLTNEAGAMEPMNWTPKTHGINVAATRKLLRTKAGMSDETVTAFFQAVIAAFTDARALPEEADELLESRCVAVINANPSRLREYRQAGEWWRLNRSEG